MPTEIQTNMDLLLTRGKNVFICVDAILIATKGKKARAFEESSNI